MSALPTTSAKLLTWLITGSSSGFGLSLTRIAQAGGHNVIATSRNPSATPDLVSEVESKGGKWLQLDVTSRDSADIINDLEKSGQEIDVLVNNAGFCIFGPVETATEDELRAQMESMYFGPLRLIRAVLPYMRSRKSGVIVNMSSGASLDGNPSMGGYAGAKAGLDGNLSLLHTFCNIYLSQLIFFLGLTKILAKEVAQFNIRALTVVLGTYNTNFGRAAAVGKTPIPDDYNGSMAVQMIQYVKAGIGKPNGDKDKAMRAVYDVVVGAGVGAGREAERFLPLGSDMTTRVQMVQDYLAHGIDAFKDITNNVGLDA
jgi:NAD(P)-dependent dehydrogenase (short-subunit alcohol dehydrogenase family)